MLRFLIYYTPFPRATQYAEKKSVPFWNVTLYIFGRKNIFMVKYITVKQVISCDCKNIKQNLIRRVKNGPSQERIRV